MLTGHTESVWCVEFLPTGTELATCSDDGTARIWNQAGAQIAILHVRATSTLAFYKDSSYVITGQPDDGIWWINKFVRFAPGEIPDTLLGIHRRDL